MPTQTVNKTQRKTDYWLLITRISGLLLIILSVAQFSLLVKGRNLEYPLLSYSFLSAILFTIISTIISVFNSWFYKEPILYTVNPGFEPKVGVIVPTCGEPTEMVIKTIESVLSQNWPIKKLKIVISDDSRNSDLERKIMLIATNFPNVLYFNPHPKGSAYRLGDGKAGNLNSALVFLLNQDPTIEFIETRDADDLVGSKDFLRLTIGAMLADKKISFVQTIKQALTSKGDPFLNEEKLWYERTINYRAAVNSVFPCGSGLVWRTRELLKIKGFPSWNLVEDLHSGYKSLKLGGKSHYLPIVGTIAQSAPEDIPNYYKQRGTWAIDSMRLFFWDNSLFTRKLNIWQSLQFFETGFSYLLSIIVAIIIFTISSCLGYSVCPTDNNSPLMLLVSLMFIATMEVYSISRARGMSYREVWKARQTWIGLLPVFAISTFKALFYGPNNKPSYKVTRKNQQIGFYWKEVLPQILFVSLLAYSVIRKFVSGNELEVTDLILLFWSIFLIYGFTRVISLSFYGINFRELMRTKIDMAFSVGSMQKPENQLLTDQ